MLDLASCTSETPPRRSARAFTPRARPDRARPGHPAVANAQRPAGDLLAGLVQNGADGDLAIRRLGDLGQEFARRVQFTLKAEQERLADGLTVEDVMESILNANAIKKTLRSRSPRRTQRSERLYVIESASYAGTWIYTKGTIRRRGAQEIFYVFISSKLSV